MIAETAKKKTKALVIGTRHEYQRHQDTMSDREAIRNEFEQRVRRVIEEQNINLIAEEAGDDTEVLEHLRKEEEATPPELAGLFAGTETVEDPVSTIAKQIADEHSGGLTQVDIRPPNADAMTIEQRDEAMATKVMEVLGTADSVLVIVGECHRAGVEELLKNKGLTVKSMRFPE